MTDVIPFSLPIDVMSLPPKGRDYDLVPNESERDALARALGLEALESLRAHVSVTPGAGGSVTVSGSIDARLVQACIVTLVPVPATLHDTITRLFVVPPPAPEKAEAKAEKKPSKRAKKPAESEDEEEHGWVDPNAEITDPIVGGKIDLGEVVTEQLSLSLNPYPRAPGATFPGINPGEQDEGEPATGPFAALANLKVRKSAPRRGETKTAGKARPKGGR